jgi:hypothetical protein
MKMRNWKVWGVLGLLLALGLAVGYGQEKQTICEVSPNFSAIAPCQLFIINMDAHPTRNIQYQWQNNVAYFFATLMTGPQNDPNSPEWDKNPDRGGALLRFCFW